MNYKAIFFFALIALSVANEHKFIEFVRTYNKEYSSVEETMTRFMHFKNNLAKIEEMNAKSSASFSINKFADLSPEEFRQHKRGFVAPPAAFEHPRASLLSTKDTPTSYDWRDHGAVSPVKDQGQCGSCWSFSTTQALEGQWFLAGNTMTTLSESNLVDCSHDCWYWPDHGEACNNGCNGGLQPCAYQYIMKNGIDSEDNYPYQPEERTCNFDPNSVAAKMTSWEFVSTDEDQIAAYLVKNGPLAIACDASEWSWYSGGIYDATCDGQIDHAILLVGFGEDNGTPYWIVKNSWGEEWGENGYIRLKRGVDECRVADFVSRPIV